MPQTPGLPATGCCGPHACSCEDDFEGWFCQIRSYLYPDFDGHLCQDGVFDNLIRSLARPFWEIYRRDCALCGMAREYNPLTACCLQDAWLREYGIPDECGGLECWQVDDNAARVTIRAMLQARVWIEWHGLPDAMFFHTIAYWLGLDIEILAPTMFSAEQPLAVCCIVPSWGLQTRPAPNTLGCGGPTVGKSFKCRPLKSQIAINIKGAPETITATICSPIGQPLCFNPFVHAYKCLIRRYKPCNLDVCFLDNYEGNIRVPPISYEPCPQPDGETFPFILPASHA